MKDDEILAKAKELDQMEERDVTTEEANVLERVLRAFSENREPKIKDCQKVKAMYDKYLGPSDDEDEDDEHVRGEEDVEEGEDNLEMLA